MHAYTLTLDLKHDMDWNGSIEGSGSIMLQGDHTWSWLGSEKSFTGTIQLQNKTNFVLRTRLHPETKLDLQNAENILTLHHDQSIQTLTGRGVIACNQHTLTVTGPSSFYGFVQNGTLLIQNTTLNLLTSYEDSCIGHIHVQSNAALNVQTFHRDEALTLDKTAHVTVARTTQLQSIDGSGRMTLNAPLTLHDNQSKTWKGTFEGISPITFGSLISDSIASFTLDGDHSNTFSGELNIYHSILNLHANARFAKETSITLNQGTLTLAHANNFLGEIKIQNDAQIISSNSITLSTPIFLYTHAKLNWNPQSGTLTLNRPISGQGTLIKQGAGTLVYEESGSFYQGQLDVQDGTLELHHAFPKLSTLTVQSHLRMMDNLTCTALKGTGTITLEKAITLTLSEDQTIQTDLQNGTFQVQGPHTATLAQSMHLNRLKVAEKTRVQTLEHVILSDSPELEIDGELHLASAQSVQSIQNNGTLEWNESLACIGRACQSIIQGTMRGPRFILKEGSVHFKTVPDIHELIIQKGILQSSDTLQKVIQTLLEPEGILQGFGTIGDLTWKGLLIPYGETGNPTTPYGQLQIQNLTLNEHPQLWISLESRISSQLTLDAPVRSLQPIEIILDLRSRHDLSYQTFTLMQLSDSTPVTLPQLSRQYGLSSVLPEETFRIEQMNHKILLRVKELPLSQVVANPYPLPQIHDPMIHN